MRPTRSSLTATLAVAGLAAALLAVGPYALLVMAPALALAWLVAVGLFTGEDSIAWVRRAIARARTKRPRAAAARAQPAPWVGPRGGLLIAAALASRPPPAL